MDNVFVFAVIFAFFRVPIQYHVPRLFWGILGASCCAGVVLAGVQLIHHFDWVLRCSAAADLRRRQADDKHGGEVEPEKNVVLRLARRMLQWPGRPSAARQRLLRSEGGRLALPRCSWCCWSSKAPTFSSPSTAYRPSRHTTDAFIVFTSNVLRSWACGRSTSCCRRDADVPLSALRAGRRLAFVGVNMVADYFLAKTATT